MPGTFELYQDESGAYRFRLKASDGQVIASSEGYERKGGALSGIDSVRQNAADANVDDQTHPPQTPA
ncbi:YegP family protein [Amnibacterium sp.]|uniref:YegP family protein n=1 Tax=Amnibacterium sp. TaxID=1872496 RepID=UPI002606C5E8|nr:YegP family protein [Amnibacterium sp.]MCU1474468.1 hypothetical protein [Amnibacterium sp.]